MTCEEQTQKFHTDDVLLPSSEWCFSLMKGNFHPIRSTTRIWVVIRHQHGISALVSQTSFRGETRGGVKKRRLLWQATVQWVHLNINLQIVEKSVADQLTPRTYDIEVQGSSLAHRVDSLDKELYSTLSLFTQVYKWVLATYCWEVTLRWTGTPSRGE